MVRLSSRQYFSIFPLVFFSLRFQYSSSIKSTKSCVIFCPLAPTLGASHRDATFKIILRRRDVSIKTCYNIHSWLLFDIFIHQNLPSSLIFSEDIAMPPSFLSLLYASRRGYSLCIFAPYYYFIFGAQICTINIKCFFVAAQILRDLRFQNKCNHTCCCINCFARSSTKAQQNPKIRDEKI